MKCQKCGKGEVNFHYTSNINGCVTEAHLCSECAADSGYDFGRMLDFERFFPTARGRNRMMSTLLPELSFGMPLRASVRPRLAVQPQGETCNCCNGVAEAQGTEVDEEMAKRRELYKEMRIAAENDEFEKAAGIRDQIKAMEALRQEGEINEV
ncbi:MAG: UvrB/UvrC motif-containing protein [Oscillospiraceae bacterium]|nr:UvrB/UvrC motif-containing protein [Oscillospiraceae bacterium]